MRTHHLLAAIAAVVVAGCASSENRPADSGYEEKTVITGSRIPVKGGTGAATPVDQGDILQNRNIYIPAKGAGGN